MKLPKRKPNRLPNFDYSTPGAYFITICTQDKKCILGQIVGGGDLDAPQISLSTIGKKVWRNIELSRQIPNIHVDKYVIMPNHIHFILVIANEAAGASPRPTI